MNAGRIDVAVATIVVMLIGSAVAALLLVPVNHDICWALHFASRVRAGQRLYGTIIGVNPPIIFRCAQLVPVLRGRTWRLMIGRRSAAPPPRE